MDEHGDWHVESPVDFGSGLVEWVVGMCRNGISNLYSTSSGTASAVSNPTTSTSTSTSNSTSTGTPTTSTMLIITSTLI